jgi:hypothetical protein
VKEEKQKKRKEEKLGTPNARPARGTTACTETDNLTTKYQLKPLLRSFLASYSHSTTNHPEPSQEPANSREDGNKLVSLRLVDDTCKFRFTEFCSCRGMETEISNCFARERKGKEKN